MKKYLLHSALTSHSCFAFLLSACWLLSSSTASAAIFADILIDHSPTGTGEIPTSVLGAPDDIHANFDNSGPSLAGFVTVAFSAGSIADVVGDDIFIHLDDPNDFEPFNVLGSLNGADFFMIGQSGPLGGRSVIGFDLSATNEASATQIMIQNGSIRNDVDWEGPDIDAISISAIPEPTMAFPLMCIGVCLLSVRRRRQNNQMHRSRRVSFDSRCSLSAATR